MGSTRLMLIRHAEKSGSAPDEQTVDARGQPDPQSLSVRGWQRAGALVRALAPLDGHFADPRMARPVALFAAASTLRHPSTRPVDTLQPLAAVLALAVDTRHACEDPPRALLAAAEACDGPVLVCWRHDELPALARARAPGADVPARWPDGCHDVMWVLQWDGAPGAGWRFEQLPLCLLAGDRLQV